MECSCSRRTASALITALPGGCLHLGSLTNSTFFAAQYFSKSFIHFRVMFINMLNVLNAAVKKTKKQLFIVCAASKSRVTTVKLTTPTESKD